MNILNNIKEPYVLLLIGVPMSGKSTWLSKNFKGKIISRDSIIMELCEYKNDYNKCFNTVNQKDVDKKLKESLKDSGLSSENIAIDMTNLSAKRRKGTLKNFPNHYKIALIFDTPSSKILEDRNKTRTVNENKSIPDGVMKNMIASYQSPTKEEGFDKIINIK